jgi:uncharacterized protein YbjT (DUF2867 family)
MKILIIGGTGTVGSEVVKTLFAAGHTLRVLTTSEEKAEKFLSAIEPYIGTLENPEAIAAAFNNIDAVFMLNAHTQTEIQQGLNAVSAAAKAGVKKFVFQSIHHVRSGQQIDHFKSKVVIEDALIKSGLNYVFLNPNNFYQNDLFFKDSITKYRLYNQPLGSVGLNRNDTRDIAEAVLKVIETDKYDGKTIAIVGPDILTGESTSKILSEFLGYQVNYKGDDLEKFKNEFSQWLPEWQVEDWATMYAHFQKEGLVATKEELYQLEEVLGHKPRSYKTFLQDYFTVSE